MEVMGLMLGEFVDDYTVKCVDVFAMPQVRLSWLSCPSRQGVLVTTPGNLVAVLGSFMSMAFMSMATGRKAFSVSSHAHSCTC